MTSKKQDLGFGAFFEYLEKDGGPWAYIVVYMIPLMCGVFGTVFASIGAWIVCEVAVVLCGFHFVILFGSYIGWRTAIVVGAC